MAEALAAYEEGLEIRRLLSASDPGHAGWARDLIVSNVKIAQSAGDSELVQRHYAAALAIAEQLAGSGRLAPVDAWMVDELKSRLAAVQAAQ